MVITSLQEIEVYKTLSALDNQSLSIDEALLKVLDIIKYGGNNATEYQDSERKDLLPDS
jgi:hypothetical protein